MLQVLNIENYVSVKVVPKISFDITGEPRLEDATAHNVVALAAVGAYIRTVATAHRIANGEGLVPALPPQRPVPRAPHEPPAALDSCVAIAIVAVAAAAVAAAAANAPIAHANSRLRLRRTVSLSCQIVTQLVTARPF